MIFEDALKKACAEYTEIAVAFETNGAWVFGYAIKVFAPLVRVDKVTGEVRYRTMDEEEGLQDLKRIDLSKYSPDEYMIPANYIDYEAARKVWLTGKR